MVIEKKKIDDGLLYRREDSHMTKIFNRKGYMMLAIAFALCFNGAKAIEKMSGNLFANVMLYFHGDPTNQSEVEDESNWTTSPNGQSCDNQQKAACALEVDASDVSGSTLDDSKVQIEGIEAEDGDGYLPKEASGSNATHFRPINRTL